MDIESLYKLCNIYIKYITKRDNLDIRSYNLKDGVECFGFIPYNNIDYLIAGLEKAFECLQKEGVWKPKFLDIGCGIGNIMLLANVVGYEPAGLEYNHKYCKIARQLCSYFNFPNTRVFEGDMRTFENYHKYDLLYYYEPIANNEKMHEFSVKLSKKIKIGAYILCIASSVTYSQSENFERINYGLWKRIK